MWGTCKNETMQTPSSNLPPLQSEMPLVLKFVSITKFMVDDVAGFHWLRLWRLSTIDINVYNAHGLVRF